MSSGIEENGAQLERSRRRGGDPSGDVDLVIDRLRRHFATGETRSIDWRLSQLEGLDNLLSKEVGSIEEALFSDLGRSATEVFLTDVYAVRREVAALRRGLRRWSRDERVRLPLVLLPGRSFIRREPLGVVLVLGTWNYPVNLVLVPVAAALAAGNCVIAKPSEQAPAASSLLAELIPRYLDADAVSVVEGGPKTSEELLDEGVDFVFFTGSSKVGKLVAERAGRSLTPVTLELGGKSPALVAGDADLESAARRIAFGKLVNAGQSCIAPDYALVEENAVTAFCQAVERTVRRFYGDDPSSSRDLGRILNDTHVARLERLLQNHGGRVLFGGEVDKASRYVSPTLVLDPSPRSELMTEEIFGPILPVVCVKDLAEATAFVRERPTPLALYVFTKDRSLARRVLATTRSGTACVNATVHQFTSSRLPFGGVGQSGMGRYHGRYGFETFTQLRPVLEKPPRPDIPLGYPPYGAVGSRLLRAALGSSGFASSRLRASRRRGNLSG